MMNLPRQKLKSYFDKPELVLHDEAEDDMQPVMSLDNFDSEKFCELVSQYDNDEEEFPELEEIPELVSQYDNYEDEILELEEIPELDGEPLI
jgi:hypothetical protein